MLSDRWLFLFFRAEQDLGNNEVAVFPLARSLPNDLWGVFCAGVIKTEGVRESASHHRGARFLLRRERGVLGRDGALQERCGGVVYGSSRN